MKMGLQLSFSPVASRAATEFFPFACGLQLSLFPVARGELKKMFSNVRFVSITLKALQQKKKN